MKCKPPLISIFLLLLATIVLPVVVGGCAQTTDEGPGKTVPVQPQINKDVTPEEANTLIQDNLDNADFIIIDVRTPGEYADGHIENSLNLDVNAGNFRDEIGKLDKNDTYLIYCRSGNRSSTARNIMLELGFNFIYHMLGGISGWQAAGLPVVK